MSAILRVMGCQWATCAAGPSNQASGRSQLKRYDVFCDRKNNFIGREHSACMQRAPTQLPDTQSVDARRPNRRSIDARRDVRFDVTMDVTVDELLDFCKPMCTPRLSFSHLRCFAVAVPTRNSCWPLFLKAPRAIGSE